MFLSIIESGIIINAAETLHLINNVYNIRLFKEFYKYFRKDEYLVKYDRRKNVSKGDIWLKHFSRKVKSNKTYIQNKVQSDNVFENLLYSIYNFDPTSDKFIYKQIENSLLNVIRDQKHSYKVILKHYFTFPPLRNMTRSEIKHHFAPLFYFIFENTPSGLLTEDHFNSHYINIKGYDGNYRKYYSTRLDTLVGFKEFKK